MNTSPTLPNVLDAARRGRASANHLSSLCATGTLTAADAKRLLLQIQAGFDAVLGPTPERPAPPNLTLHRGGRP